jgi:hypothetical protein
MERTMRDGFAFAMLLLVVLNPFAVATTVGLWLTLIGWVWNSVLCKWRFLTPAARKITGRTIVLVSWIAAAGILVNHWLGLLSGFNILLFPLILLSPSYKTSAVLTDWWYTVPRVWLALAVEGALVLSTYCELPTILAILKINPDRRRFFMIWTLVALLVIGIITGVIGFALPIGTAFIAPDTLDRSLDLDYFSSLRLIPFCLVNLILAIGLSVWLIKANDDQRLGVRWRAGIGALVLVAVVVAWVAGNYLSTLYAHNGSW